MPSLRRSFSSPSVRSSPYSSVSTHTTRTRPTPRRSSASTTAERRVLADIEWWRVCDGQCEDYVHELDPDVPSGGTVTFPASGDSLDPMQYVYLDSLAAQSIAPHSPPGSRHSRESSVESTPELFTSPLETIQLALANSASRPLDALFPFPPPSPLTRVASRQAHPFFGLRSVSAPGLSQRGILGFDFADIGGDSFTLDQNLFQ